MTRLPIHSVLYVAIFGLLGGSGWQFYQAAVVERFGAAEGERRQEANKENFLRILGQGADRVGAVVVGPSYGEPEEFWKALRDANFHGYVQAAKKRKGPITGNGPGGDPDQTPLEDLFVLTAVAAAGPDSRIVIRYKPAANVEPPAGLLPAGPAAPAYGYPHHLRPGDTLWPPFAHVRLVRITDSHAVFVREDPEKPEAEWVEEPVYREALELPADLPSDFLQWLGRDDGSLPVSRRSDTTGSSQPSGWQRIERTTEVSADRFHIGTQDGELFRRQRERVFQEDVGTADWCSRGGALRGVRITKLSPGYERFGIDVGDVILAINGDPVGSKAEAMCVGKRLYARGIRTFEIAFLTETGQQITRTYVAPDED